MKTETPFIGQFQLITLVEYDTLSDAANGLKRAIALFLLSLMEEPSGQHVGCII